MTHKRVTQVVRGDAWAILVKASRCKRVVLEAGLAFMEGPSEIPKRVSLRPKRESPPPSAAVCVMMAQYGVAWEADSQCGCLTSQSAHTPPKIAAKHPKRNARRTSSSILHTDTAHSNLHIASPSSTPSTTTAKKASDAVEPTFRVYSHVHYQVLSRTPLFAVISIKTGLSNSHRFRGYLASQSSKKREKREDEILNLLRVICEGSYVF